MTKEEKLFSMIMMYEYDHGSIILDVKGFKGEEKAKKALVEELEDIKKEIEENDYEVDEEIVELKEIYIRDDKDNRYSVILKEITFE